METTKKTLTNEALNLHLQDAAQKLTGSEYHKALTQIIVPEVHKKQFRTTAPHAMCGCYGCVELAKIFVLDTDDMKQRVVDAATMCEARGS